MATKNGHNRFSPEDRYLADGHEVDESGFPRLDHLSSAFLLYCLPYPTSPKLPEFVYVPISEQAPFGERDRGLWAAMLDWNTAWEAAEYRSHVFPDLPPQLAWLTKVADRNIHLLPDGVPARYYGYAPLFHLLTRRTLEQNGLPLLRRGQWPYTIRFPRLEQLLPADFDARLARAFAAHIWPYLESGSPPSAFSDSYPLKLLAHNLDFWLPYAYAVAAERVRAFGRAPITEPEQAEAIQRARTGVPEGVAVDRPLRGGQVWVGEGEAQEATSELVELADANGSLRAIVDAIRSNRIADDFSDQWSYAKEDFERKLYRKRNKVKVAFVELSDTVPVHGPDSEVHEDLLWADFLAVLDAKERRIVVLLRNGITKVGDIAQRLGYANHTPVSKTLARIRRKAEIYLE